MDFSKLKKHRKRPSGLTALTNISSSPVDEMQSAPPFDEPARMSRPQLHIRTSAKRPSSTMFGSFKASVKSTSDKSDAATEPMSAASTAPSLSFGEALVDTPSGGRPVLMHGEIQTSAGMFRKKKEYVVLTDQSITRYKTQAKAAEIFSGISPTISRSNTIKHGQMPSRGSSGDFHAGSDTSGERSGRISLSQIVAVHMLNDGKPYFAIEICFLDQDSAQAGSLTLQFSNPTERTAWLEAVRLATTDAHRHDKQPVSPFNLENAARSVERDQDYDPANCAIFRVVQRHVHSKSTSRSSSDDLTKVASVVGFLAVGVHKLHLIPLAKPVSRASSPSLVALRGDSISFGILTLAGIEVSDLDDGFDLTFRRPLQRHRTLHLSSSASYDIITRLYHTEAYLRPESTHRFFQFIVPETLERLLPSNGPPNTEDYSAFQRTLTAYCVAYGISPSNICYAINHECEDAPLFELLPPTDAREVTYGPLELLAILRTLRYNESFGSISLANVNLACLQGLHDNYGREYICTRTKHGTAIKLTADQLANSDLLIQEIRAVAATSKRLRRMDFSNCIVDKTEPVDVAFDDPPISAMSHGCGILEALSPLCRQQTTNVDWICLNGITLQDSDLDYLVGAAVDRACHFRAIELNACGLTDRTLGLVLDSLRAHDNTLEAIEIAGNTARIEPTTFDSQISVFGFVRRLDLSNVSRTSGPEPLLRADTLLIWRLGEIRLSGTSLNAASVDALATYLAHDKSDSLHHLYLDNCYLSGTEVALLLQSMVRASGEVRQMHLDVSQNDINRGLDDLTRAISAHMTPTHLSMRAIEYRDETPFRKLLAAFTANKSILSLNLSQTALPADASEECCRVLTQLLSDNKSLIDLDLSGEESRLAISKFGAGINKALVGLKTNTTLRTFHIERQKLGVQGADTLADVLRSNQTLQELYCGNNEIPLQGLTELVNALIHNTSIVYLPAMEDGRAAAFKAAEKAMLQMGHVEATPSPPIAPRAVSYGSTNTLKKGMSAVKRTAQRTVSHHTPSFPALHSASNRITSPIKPKTPPSTARLSLTSTGRRMSMDLLNNTARSSFTIQDVHTTQRLLTEQWDRQCYRLAQYLERNWCLLNDIPVPMEVEDEKFERPETASSLAVMLEQVKIDTTPRVERDLYFDAMPSQTDLNSKLSFKQFLLESGPTSPTAEGAEQMQLPASDAASEPKTPTQRVFPL